MKFARLASMTVVLALGACASTPTTHFHTLLPTPAAAPAAALRLPLARWELLPVSVPVQADQAPWLVRLPDDSLAVLEFERWAAPLGDEIRAALADRIRLAAPLVQQAAGWRIAVEVQRFDSAPARYARIDTEWSVRPGDGGPVQLRCRSSIEQTPTGPSYAALAEAHRAALARLADIMAAAMQALDKGTPPSCA